MNTENHKMTNLELEKKAKEIIRMLIDAEIPESEWQEILAEIEKESKKDIK